MLSNVFRRIIALPLIAKALLIIATLVLLGLSVLFSPFVVVLALLLLLVAIFALLIRIIRRRPLRTWGLIALASLAPRWPASFSTRGSGFCSLRLAIASVGGRGRERPWDTGSSWVAPGSIGSNPTCGPRSLATGSSSLKARSQVGAGGW